MTDESLCHIRVTRRGTESLLACTAEDVALLLGVAGSEANRLRALTEEAVETIVRDAFEDAPEVDISLDVTRTAGGFTVVLADHGAPMDIAHGGYPPRLADLVRLGFADGLEVSYLPRQGNRVAITKHLSYASIATDAAFTAASDREAAELLEVDEDGEAIVDVRPMTPGDVVAVARLFYRTYGYSASYASIVYEPDRLAEYVASGRHFATVAVTPSGRIVGHLASSIEERNATTGPIGLLAVDPAYRRLHIAARVGWAHITRLLEHGFVGQYTEAVTVHTGSQATALKSGAHEVGLMLGGQTSELDFRGFDDTPRHRRAALIFYGHIGNQTERTVHAPQTYRDVIERIYAEAGLARTVHSKYERQPDDAKPDTRLRVTLSHETGVARIRVESYGADFLAALQENLRQLRLNRYDLIMVYLPMSDPATSHYGAGLHELGLSFCGVYPEYRDGDVLVLQSLNNVEVFPEEINVASELGEFMRDFVVADFRLAADLAEQRSRSRAHMARIYEALD